MASAKPMTARPTKRTPLHEPGRPGRARSLGRIAALGLLAAGWAAAQAAASPQDAQKIAWPTARTQAPGDVVSPRRRPPESGAAHPATARGAVWSRPLSAVPAGRWVKIHEQGPGDAVTFARQRHGGSAFDTRRGRLVLFGSDTHGRNWTNSPLFFDVARREWSRLYPNDDPDSYRVDAAGLPVAGPRGDHPWAMHTFGAVAYDAVRDEVIVSSFPAHMEPGRFTSALAKVWPRVRRHPTWSLHLATGRWTPLAGNPVHFFPYATAFDSDRGLIIGIRRSGVFELAGSPRTWRRRAPGVLLGYHTNAVYDSRHMALVIFGDSRGTNDVAAYRPATGEHRRMPTPGRRPPRDQHAPMAFHPGLGRTVVVVDRRPSDRRSRDLAEYRAETWLYDLGADAWTRVRGATLPFGCGMNYNMAYDPARGLLLLVTNPPGQPTAVWALRL